MSKDFYFRTEDISPEDISRIFVETEIDRENVEFLKNNTTGLLVGSRGTGKTMLLRVAEKEMDLDFNNKRELSIFVTFSTAMLVNSEEDAFFFRQWMLTKILFALKRKLSKMNILVPTLVYNEYFDISSKEILIDKIKRLTKIYEKSWRKKKEDIIQEANEIINIDESSVFTDVDYFKALIEDICTSCNISKIIILFDEACHNFLPIEQREFFSLFRDLRCSNICCKAAVYPGITSYGTVQKFHDVMTQRVERDIRSHDYIEKMRKIVENQIDSGFYNILVQRGDLFNALIYSASGNPRLLLKSLTAATEEFKGFHKKNVVNVIKEYYRNKIWNEHTKLAEMYKGHKKLIDWGRNFIENDVLEATWAKNQKILDNEESSQTLYFEIEKDSPPTVKNALSILEYLGIVVLEAEGVRNRTTIYNRYQINYGVVLASEKNIGTHKIDLINRSNQIINSLTVSLCTDYNRNSQAFAGSEDLRIEFNEENSRVLKTIMDRTIDELDLSDFLKRKVREVGIEKIGEILKFGEEKLREAYMVGYVRAREISTTAYNTAIEYISG